MPKPVIFLDLDGTVFRVRERVWRVYRDILKKYGKKFLDKENYLALKRKKTDRKEILRITKADDIFEKFERDWLRNIEKPEYLASDRVSSLKKRTLVRLKKNYRLVLITARQKRQNMLKQLKDKKINQIFNQVLSGKDKYAMIREYGLYDERSVIIGDTETDILTGKRLGIVTVAVADGQRDREFLRKYKPNILIDEISRLKSSI